MGYYRINQIYPWLYSISDLFNVFCYLVSGNDSALLFDTAHGLGDLAGAVREVTDKPLVVVLGHGHVDHANGAHQFDEAWLHEDDFELCRAHTGKEIRRSFLDSLAGKNPVLPECFDADAYVNAGMGNIKKLEPGRIFDLGGLHIEVVAMEGHTAGSVGLLVREHRVLLDSDSANPHIWMFLGESLPLSRYIAMLERTMHLDFDTFFVGHSDSPMPKRDFMKFLNAARNASVDKAVPYGAFPELKGLLYREDGVEIVFSEEKLQ